MRTRKRFIINKATFLILTYPFIFISTLVGQVTIGSSLTPEAGTILQLKENNLEGANASKGLGLPRVKLVPSLTNDLAESLLSESGTLNAEDHIGLLVYNVDENTTYCPGLHAWDGDTWLPLQTHGVNFFTDTRRKADGSIESIIYPYRKFGDAGEWMLTNLRATTYADNVTNIDKNTEDVKLGKNEGKSQTEPFYYYPGATPESTSEEDLERFSKNTQYGLLYTWRAAIGKHTLQPITTGESKGGPQGLLEEPNDPENIEQVGPQGICPKGWHLPSDKEWNDLEREIANDKTGTYTFQNKYISSPWSDNFRYETSYRNNAAGHGKSMKSYLMPEYNGASKVCGEGGFNAYTSGYYGQSSTNYYSRFAYLWTSSYYYDSTFNKYRGIERRFSHAHSGVGRYVLSPECLLSVRCKKN